MPTVLYQGTPTVPTVEPWIWYLVTVATVAAVLAFPLTLQVLWTAGVPLLFGLVRLIQGDFAGQYWISVGIDVSFALILGGVLLALGWVFRAAATNVLSRDVDATIEKAMAMNDAPVVVDFVVNKDAMVWPMVAAGTSNDEIMAARDVRPDFGDNEDD